MTFRQVLDIVWRRRLLVAITTVLVIVGAFLYARLAPVTYASTTTLRYSPAGTSTLSGSSSYGSINLDLDPDFAQSPEIAKVAAGALGDDPDAVQGSVQVSTTETTRTTRMTLTATGSSPAQAKARATAVSGAFVGHLNEQLENGIKELEKELARQQKIQTDALRRLSKSPNDQLAQTQFSSANSQISQLQSQIATIQGNGAPVSILQPASNGVREGVSFLTIILIGITSGLLAGAGMALIRDQFDDHVRSTEDVEEVIGDHVIGDVAIVPSRQLKLAPLPAATRLPTPLNESIRGLRTSLEVSFPERHVAVVMTSAEPGEGKTFVSANLAVSMARAGRSVILVEADLRRPRVRTYFDLPEKGRGFANLIEAAADSEAIAAALIETPYPGLRVLPAGSSESEPADLLAGDHMRGVVDRLRGLADFVLLDSPPGLALTDAAILGRAADGVLVVSALNRTRGAALRATLQLLNAKRVNVVGVIVNRSRRATVRSYGNYYHDERTRDAEPDAEDGLTDEDPEAFDSEVVAERLIERESDADVDAAPDDESTRVNEGGGEATDTTDPEQGLDDPGLTDGHDSEIGPDEPGVGSPDPVTESDETRESTAEPRTSPAPGRQVRRRRR